jgi:hypothetical protein
MLSLPKKLSSPFGILGDDAKLAFRTQPGGIAKLFETRNISAADETYWSQVRSSYYGRVMNRERL